ncbi:hypothetical protein [Porticoccus sp.]|uniref:hypothetical protein n=1 Tax=Porticoccus sp. TaxID=2024853 RepID=UPI003F6980E8
MKTVFRKIFWPILRFFERNASAQGYRPLNRKILLSVGILFWILTGISLYFVISAAVIGGLIPVIGFFIAGTICLVVALLGSDGAVVKIWGNR